MTLLYLLKQKSEVTKCFQHFDSYVRTQFDKRIKVLRSDNETEYTNKEFGAYLSSQRIQHQTACSAPAQNGVVERKNRHLMEVARALIFQMNMPKYLWSDAVLTASHLIN